MNHDAFKQAVALSALDFIEPGMIIGIGSGTTVNHFIEALKKVKGKLEGAVASSLETAKRLKAASIPVIELNSVNELPLFVDSADEINPAHQMNKGGGGALTGEKIVAAVAKKFLCIVDRSKQVDVLGRFPVAIEVIPMARSFVARQLVQLGGTPIYRQGYVTDYGNVILDVHQLKLLDPIAWEQKLNNIPGVVTNGLFADRPADTVLVATQNGVHQLP